MKLLVLLCVVLSVLLLNVAHVACAFKPTKLFVFGDSFVDTGNLPKLPRNVTRNWYHPYGFTWPLVPTGRFSNGMLQTDFFAKLLGVRTPPPYARRGYYGSRQGMNFAAGGAGVEDVPQKVPNLNRQIDFFEDMLSGEHITPQDIKQAVAHVAISGNDFAKLRGKDPFDIYLALKRINGEHCDDVLRLHKLGFSKIIVNNLQPLGCMPWLSRELNYTECADDPNQATDFYNGFFADNFNASKLTNETVMLLDLNKAFQLIVDPLAATDRRPTDFLYKLEPCCESFDPNGYCGQKDSTGVNQYRLCNDPWSHFYWDGVHPTQAGWKAVMDYLKDPIMQFLAI